MTIDYPPFFQSRGLELKDTKSFFAMLQCMNHDGIPTEKVDLKTVVACVLRLQGCATSIDLQTLHFDVKNHLSRQKSRLSHIENQLAALLDRADRATPLDACANRPHNLFAKPPMMKVNQPLHEASSVKSEETEFVKPEIVI